MTNKLMRGVAPWAAALVLVACGGGGNDAPPVAADPLREIPVSASQSAAGMVGYLRSVQPLDAEARDPVALDAYVAPLTDDMEPLALGG